MEQLPGTAVDAALCARCSAIDFSIFETGKVVDFDVRDGVFLQNLGSLTSASGASCSLCHFFSTAFPHLRYSTNEHSEPPSPRNIDHHLRAYSSLLAYHGVTNKVLWRKLHRQDRILLAIVRDGDVNPKNLSFFSSIPSEASVEGKRKYGEETSFGGRLVSPHVDFHQVIEWMDFCQQNHENCAHSDKESKLRRYQKNELQVYDSSFRTVSTCAESQNVPTWPSELRVIDCNTSHVVPIPPESLYIAISYVWGEPRENEQRMDPYREFGDLAIKLPALMPLTIRDAIEAVRRMGMQYLWVDQYCIPQLDGPAKTHQIAQMHLIYKCAYATIVAASGTDAYSGLPGVSLPRRPQPQITFSCRTLASTMIGPQQEVLSSVWCTRGWTYQEGVFSGRCIFWMDDQVYFECNAMNAGEAVSKPLAPLHTLKGDSFRSGIQQSLFKSPGAGGDMYMDINGFRLERKWYSKTKYGAFVGDKYQEVETYQIASKDLYLFHHYLEKYTERQLRYSSDSLNAFAGLLGAFEDLNYSVSPYWGIPIGKEHTSTLQRNLSWYHIEGTIPARRPEFPSWSWAGWSGAVKFDAWKPFMLSDKSSHLESRWPIFRVNTSRHGNQLHRLQSPKDALKLTQRGGINHILHVAADLITIKLVYLSNLEDIHAPGFTPQIALYEKIFSQQTATDFKPGFYSCVKFGQRTLLIKASISVAAPEKSRQRALLIQKPCIGLYLGYDGYGSICVMLIQRKTKTTFGRIGYISPSIDWSRSLKIKSNVPGMKRGRTGRHLFQLE